MRHLERLRMTMKPSFYSAFMYLFLLILGGSNQLPQLVSPAAIKQILISERDFYQDSVHNQSAASSTRACLFKIYSRPVKLQIWTKQGIVFGFLDSHIFQLNKMLPRKKWK